MSLEIPEVVIDRLPVYARTLALLTRQGREVVSSQELGIQLGVTPAQIRKDLSYFGRFGKQGRGYNVKRLLEELRQILGLTRSWSMALVGVGKLGQAIVAYDGFVPQGFRIVEAFDADPKLVGTKVNDLVVKSVESLPGVLRGQEVEIGIVAVPAANAQQVIDMLVASGVKGILNYAPIAPQVPSHVRIKDIDPVLSLQSMTYYVKNLETPAK
ncbi:MAG: redox-sensing transcriptional repressor Rex [Chloroflexi bacterium]|nr:redox-sensing transcriptional repressor Rex [Chloroflexota bacterium]